MSPYTISLMIPYWSFQATKKVKSVKQLGLWRNESTGIARKRKECCWRAFSVQFRLCHQDDVLTYQDANVTLLGRDNRQLPWTTYSGRFNTAADGGIAYCYSSPLWCCLSVPRQRKGWGYPLQLQFYPAIHFLPAVLRYFYLCMQPMF